jgi:hypothetical protein
LELERDAEASVDLDEALRLLEQAGAADHAVASDDVQNRIREEENLWLMKATAEARLGNLEGSWLAAEQGRASILKRDIARIVGRAVVSAETAFDRLRGWLVAERVAILTFGTTKFGTLALSAGASDTRPSASLLPLKPKELEELLATNDIFSAVPDLSKKLVHPLRDRIVEIARDARALYVIPGSGLFHAPFAALTIEEASVGREARRISDLCPIAMTPSLAILLWCASRRVAGRSRALLAVGVGEAGAGQRQVHFRDQAERIAALPWPAQCEKLLDDDALVEQITHEAPKFPVLFIAAHGKLDSDVKDAMASSRIELARKQSLSSRDVLNWKLSAELVFLNACQSGRFISAGRAQVNGFFRAFPIAGANTLIAALTYVDPGAASDLAELFFRNWLSGSTKIEALHKAQEELKKTREAKDWASHCLIGDFV